MIELLNFSFPNDLHITWSLMIVIYPYITGIVAGAFVVSSLYHVFGKEELKPVAGFCIFCYIWLHLIAPKTQKKKKIQPQNKKTSKL
jgi:Ni/Fe-hydrogenase subunit HybB-like protein